MVARPTIALAALTLMLLPAAAVSQDLAGSLDQLRVLGLVKLGDTVYVTDANGRRTKGTMEGVSPTSLVLATGRFNKTSRDFPEADVRKIQRGDSLLNGTLIGLGIGLGILFASPGFVCDLPDDECAAIAQVVIGLPAVAGAAIVGAVVDASMRKTVYLAPVVSGSTGLRLSPILSNGRKGVLASLQF